MGITRRALAALIPFSALAGVKSVGGERRPPIGDPGKDTPQLEFHNGIVGRRAATGYEDLATAATDVTKMYVEAGRFVIRHEDVATHTVSYRYLDLRDPSGPWLASPK